jgi:hypothetical protein
MFWGTNYPPQFKEATKAITNRMVVIECRREFIEDEPPVGAAKEARRLRFNGASEMILKTELPGLLNWAIAGLRRVMERGYIETTADIRSTADTIRRDSNLAAGFIEDCVDFDPNRRVSVPDFCAALSVWWAENKGENRYPPSNDSIGRAVVALGEPRIATNPSELRDNRRRYYAGLVLNDEGLTFWKRAVESKLFEGKTASTTSPQDDPNGYVPTSWNDKPSVVAMRDTQEKRRLEVSQLMSLRSDTDTSGSGEASSSQVSKKPDEPSF